MEFNYLVEKVRMLNSLGRMSGECAGVDCSICPLSDQNNGLNITCGAFEMQHSLEATEIVRKWAEKHPIKTRKDVLLEKFPNAKFNDDGIPCVCAHLLGLKGTDECYSPEACMECWNTEVVE